MKLKEILIGKYTLLLIAAVIYLILGILNFNLFFSSLNYFKNLILQILPILALVFFFIYITNLLLDPKKVTRFLGVGSSFKGWIISIIGGLLSTGPIYMWYPLLSDLKEKGMRTALIGAFLYNRAIKIPLLPMMLFYFGWEFTIILTIYMIIFSVINGFILEKIIMFDLSQGREVKK